MRVLATERVTTPTWSQGTITLPTVVEGAGVRRYVRALRNLWTVWRNATPDDVVVWTDDNPLSANLHACLQGKRRPTLVRTDPLFHAPTSERRLRFLQRALEPVDRLIVWAPMVAERYHRVLGVPREKMTPVRFHHTLAGFPSLPITTGDYVFSGGDSMRDYPSLLEAVRGLPVPVRIATHWQPPPSVSVPSNVQLGPVSGLEYGRLLAGARMAIFPLQTDSLRTSGQQSYLNAMALGKPVIVTDPYDAPFYIDDGVTGRIVPSSNAAALRDAIVRLLDEPDEASAMAERARAFALPIDQEYTWSRVLEVAHDAWKANHSGTPRDAAARTARIVHS